MNFKFNQHIGIFENAISSKWCNEIIKIYKKNLELTKTRFEDENKISSLIKNDHNLPENLIDNEIKNYFYDIFINKVIKKYNQKYSFKNSGEDSLYEITDFKIQKTLPTEGYHIWHYENEGYNYRNRVITWMVYLNDVKEGGETEFLHQSLRVKPKQGTILVWPAGFTHIHRGNPPLSGEKYVVTGWFDITPPLKK